MQDHTRACVCTRAYASTTSQSHGVVDAFLKVCMCLCGVTGKQQIISVCVKCRILSNLKFVVCESNITDTTRHVLFGE